jgi:hypothetical protein
MAAFQNFIYRGNEGRALEEAAECGVRLEEWKLLRKSGHEFIL